MDLLHKSFATQKSRRFGISAVSNSVKSMFRLGASTLHQILAGGWWHLIYMHWEFDRQFKTAHTRGSYFIKINTCTQVNSFRYLVLVSCMASQKSACSK